jgi:Concanavalin A-like lectin/glucanases superfamily
MRAFIIVAACLIPAIARGDLVAHWHFDEAPGTAVAADAMGSYPGTLLGAADFAAGGVAGGAITLARVTSDLVDMGDVLSLNAISFTVVYWVKTTDTEFSVPLAKHLSGTVAGWIQAINPSGPYGHDTRPWFYTANIPGGEVNATTTVNDGQWHQVATVMILGAEKRIYVDGAPVEGTGLGNDPGTIGAPLLVGGISIGGTLTNMFEGAVDEVQVYDQALGDADIQFLFENPALTVCGADFNRDEAIDFFDVQAYLSAFAAGDDRADINLDGTFDFFDVQAFLAAFAAGCN